MTTTTRTDPEITHVYLELSSQKVEVSPPKDAPFGAFSSVNGEICTQRGGGSAERFEHMKKKPRWLEDWAYPSLVKGNLGHIIGNSMSDIKSVPRSEIMNSKHDF